MLEPNFEIKKTESENYGNFVIEPLPPSFANSLGNALRRTLLSSLRGAAVTQIRIIGVPHFFMPIEGVKESALEIVMNMKQLKFKIDETSQKKFKISLELKGPRKIYGKDFEGEIKPINSDLYIAEITGEKTELVIEAIVEIGYGYITAQEREDREPGFIPVDAFFSPIRRVNTRVENTRVGRRSNFEKLIIEIWTDGTISPNQALQQSSDLLSRYFLVITSKADEKKSEQKPGDEEGKKSIEKKYYEMIIDELNLPSRVVNALLKENIETVADLIKVGKEKLMKMKGVGKKSIELIENELKKINLEL
ncbi:MAG: DNA-directed RNA polymerase subunit alpha [Patescibacteria group bacterium]|nr:DNA-directed RNA polymerase subunit alpha [Patescibacteria group bacterium]